MLSRVHSRKLSATPSVLRKGLGRPWSRSQGPCDDWRRRGQDAQPAVPHGRQTHRRFGTQAPHISSSRSTARNRADHELTNVICCWERSDNESGDIPRLSGQKHSVFVASNWGISPSRRQAGIRSACYNFLISCTPSEELEVHESHHMLQQRVRLSWLLEESCRSTNVLLVRADLVSPQLV